MTNATKNRKIKKNPEKVLQWGICCLCSRWACKFSQRRRRQQWHIWWTWKRL